MFLRSISMGCNLAARASRKQQPQRLNLDNIRTLFVTTIDEQQQQPQSSSETDDSQLYIEDNLKLDIKTTDEVTTIDVVPVTTGREGKLVKVEHDTACVLCRLNLRSLDYTDVMILGQFVKRNGSLVTYHESKLCSKQYKLVERLIQRAQRCNLMPRPADYLVPGAWHDLNTYLEPDRKRDQPMKYVKKEYWKI